MSLSRFISDDKEYKYKILVYPNITFQKDLEKDSYVVVLGNIIKEMNKLRNDLHWTILSPKLISSLQFDNTEQLIVPQLTYPNSMRMSFPFKEVMTAIDWTRNDYDIVYSHLPEHTGQLKNLLYNTTNISPTIIGYTHWTEFKEITNYEYQVGLAFNIIGLLQQEKCGINTEAQKQLVLKNAREHFNDDVVKQLDEILEPHYLGWETPNYEKQTTDKNIIVYNHRPHTYKNYPWFLQQMDKLWEQRQDFEVWVPLADSKEKQYMTIDKYDRFGYFSKLSSCKVGVCCKQKYEGWAVSATDGMSVGVPYMFSDDGSYHELADDAGIYYKDSDEFLTLMNKVLDDENFRNEYSEKSLQRFEDSKWDKQILKINDMFQTAIDNLHESKETDSYKQILKIIKDKKSVTKRDITDELGWGIRIAFNSYRNRLRNEKDIRLTKNRYEVIEQ
jgi:glycosyltransferase involved in cell wall biosynthesis